MEKIYILPQVDYYKYNRFYEVSLSLFNKCNLNCKFCFQDKSSKIDIEAIKNIPDKLTSFIPNELMRTGSNGVLIRLWGGELFSDDIPDSMFEVYENLCRDIVYKLNKKIPDTEIKFICTTNGVLKNHNRLEKFLKDVNSKLALSYDPIGRFKNKKQLDMFLNTYQYFKNNLTCMAITLTKPTIYRFINNDEIFNSFPITLDIDMNYYVSNTGWEYELPSDDDLFNFYKWAMDNKRFNIIYKILNGFIFNSKDAVINSCICKNFTLYSNNEYINDCVKIMSDFPSEDFYGENYKHITWENSCDLRTSIGFIKLGCLYCKYQPLCSGICWCSIIFKYYNISKCPIQKLYEYIENNNDIKDSYIEWRNNYGTMHKDFNS
jgi:organic radical activating enzyme